MGVKLSNATGALASVYFSIVDNKYFGIKFCGVVIFKLFTRAANIRSYDEKISENNV